MAPDLLSAVASVREEQMALDLQGQGTQDAKPPKELKEQPTRMTSQWQIE